MVIKPKVGMKEMQKAKEEQEIVRVALETSNALQTDVPTAESARQTTADGRPLIPLYFPKDGMLNETDLNFLLRKAYEAAELNGQRENAVTERLLAGLGLIQLSEHMQDWAVNRDPVGCYYKVNWNAQWKRIDNYWKDQNKKHTLLYVDNNRPPPKEAW